MASFEPASSTAEVLGDALIPVINKLQDIFSQVRSRPRGLLLRSGPEARPIRAHAGPRLPPRRSRWTCASACPRWRSWAARAAASRACWRRW
jgi:hypothetical protein